jgi:WLM domain
VRYAYYANLKPRQKAVYRRSDETVRLPLPNRLELARLAAAIGKALETQDRARVERASQALAEGIAAAFEVPAVGVRVLSKRPSTSESELHGLYETRDGRAPARICVWMRTAQHKRVVAFRTFLRTLLHELCHHLDYELLKLEDSFHTEGFFKRESSLFKQLVT